MCIRDRSGSRFLFLHFLLRGGFTGAQSQGRRRHRATTSLQPTVSRYLPVLVREFVQGQILLHGRRRLNVSGTAPRCEQLLHRLSSTSLSPVSYTHLTLPTSD